jgi:polar amino acid transport system substrate-binding protein
MTKRAVPVLVAVGLLASAVAVSAAGPPTKTEGVLVVGVNLGEPGFQVGAVQGTKVVLARGFEIDLARVLAKRLAIAQVQFVHEPVFSRLYARGDKAWDMALAQVTITAGRRANVDFSTPYLTAEQGVLLAEGAPEPKSLADLRALQLCAQRGTTSVTAITSTIRPALKPILFDKQEGLLDALYQRRCQAVIDDVPILAALRRQAPDRYGRLVARLGGTESYGVVVPKGSPLRALLDRALAQLKQDGTIVTLEKRWLGADVAKLTVLR